MTEESDTVETVASALDELAEGRITLDEFNMQIHDKRYHKHGYKDGDVCKYRNHRDKDSLQDNTFYAGLGNGVQLDDAIKWLKKHVVSRIVYAKTAREFAAQGFSDVEALNFPLWGTPLNEEQHERNLILFYEVCSDLISRYPKIPFMRPVLTSWRMNNEEECRAFSTLDKRAGNKTNYIVLGDYYTGARKALEKYHIVRHEIGHSIATFGVLEKWQEFAVRFQQRDAFSKYSNDHISEYASVGIEEAIAEAFAFYTAPSYVHGSLPQEIEELVEKMLSGEIPERSTRSFAMDSKDSHTMREEIEPVDPAYYVIFDSFKPEPEDVIQWFDAKRGMLKFDTYEERFRHILGVFKVPKEWTDALCVQHPNNKWSVGAAQFVVYIYRETDTPLDKFLKKTETYLQEG